MAKKLSKFGAAFKAAKDGSTFDFGGKKYKKEYASNKKSGGSKLPKTTSVIPTPRSSVATGKRSAFSPTQDRGASGVAATVSKKPSGPSFRGGGPKIAMSQANIDKRKKASNGGFKAAMKKVANSIKMGY